MSTNNDMEVMVVLNYISNKEYKGDVNIKIIDNLVKEKKL